MISRDFNEIHDLIAKMSDEEKRELIAMLSRSVSGGNGTAVNDQHLSSDEWIRQVRQWAASHPQRDSVDDSRDSIYADRGY